MAEVPGDNTDKVISSSKYPKKSVAPSGLFDIFHPIRGFAKNAHPRLFSDRRSAAWFSLSLVCRILSIHLAAEVTWTTKLGLVERRSQSLVLHELCGNAFLGGKGQWNI
jgi:hypothetical protein